MLRTFASLAVMGVLAFGCHRLSETEKKLLGTWDTHSIDATESITFSANHTFATEGELGGDRFPIASGTWSLDGVEIVRRFTRAASKESEFMVGHELRDTISELRRDKLVVHIGITYERRK